MESSKMMITFFAFLLLILSTCEAQSKCVKLYGQCGGIGYTGPTCCEQPKPNPVYVEQLPPNAVVCRKLDNYYSQCQPICPPDKPCLKKGTTDECSGGGDDGFGRKNCATGEDVCTNPDYCWDINNACICGGSRPCLFFGPIGLCIGREAETGLCFPTVPKIVRCPGFEGEKCGGKDHVEPTSCQPGLQCVKENENFSACRKM